MHKQEFGLFVLNSGELKMRTLLDDNSGGDGHQVYLVACLVNFQLMSGKLTDGDKFNKEVPARSSNRCLLKHSKKTNASCLLHNPSCVVKHNEATTKMTVWRPEMKNDVQRFSGGSLSTIGCDAPSFSAPL